MTLQIVPHLAESNRAAQGRTRTRHTWHRAEFILWDVRGEDLIVVLKMVFAGRGHVRVGGGVSDLIESIPSRVDIECKNIARASVQLRYAAPKPDVAPDRGG